MSQSQQPEAQERREPEKPESFQYAQLQEALNPEEFKAINEHHESNPTPELLKQPIPKAIRAVNRYGSAVLLFNTADFDDDLPGTEDKIEQDAKIIELASMLQNARTQEATELFRVRRSVLGYMIISAALENSDAA